MTAEEEEVIVMLTEKINVITPRFARLRASHDQLLEAAKKTIFGIDRALRINEICALRTAIAREERALELVIESAEELAQ